MNKDKLLEQHRKEVKESQRRNRELEERRHCSAKEVTINYLESVKKDKKLQLERLEKTYPGPRPIKRFVRLDIGYLTNAIQMVAESEGE